MRKLLYLIVLLGIWFIFMGNSQTLSGEEYDRFEIRSDGTVKVDGLTFKNLSEYFKSDYFNENNKRCRTFPAMEADDILASTSDCSTSRTVIKGEYYPSTAYTIPVVFHIIYKTDGTGNISDQRINDQVKVMNEDYRAKAGTDGSNGFDTMVQFQLAGITRTANNTWFSQAESSEYTYKSQLGWDQDKYLNIYLNDADGYLGWSYFPHSSAGSVLDGVVAMYEVVGGRDIPGAAPYDQGRTVVHEVGHYLGLYHTFEDYGCYTGYTAGDLINDTNSENDEHYGCTQTYSCGTADPIHNYMNYTDDDCMYQFTQEQGNRLVCCLVNYRPQLFTSSTASITVTSPNGGESWTPGSSHNITWTSSGTVGNVKIQYTTNNGSSWSTVSSSTANDGSYTWTVPSVSSTQCKVKISEASDGSPSDTSNAVFTISSGGGGGSATISLNRTKFYFASVIAGQQTGSQHLRISNSGSGTLSWSVSDTASWLSCSPASGSGSGIVTLTVNPSGLTAGNYTGTVTVSSTNATNSPQAAAVYLTVYGAHQDQAPFGAFSTPVNGANVSSSFAVSGWVLDDVEVMSVKIYNGSSYIGDAILVEGARTDIENAYPTYPMNYKAGWGYMLLSYFLPNGGNGTYTLSAKATDKAGHTVSLGSSVIHCNNNASVKPFGAIDLPAQGGTASGSSYRNSGWVLTPMPSAIPTSGSTISVYVNGVYLGHPTYNVYRSDIASLFPGYANSYGAAAYYDINTTAYANGVYTIYWIATDNAGHADGIGSRYFTIQNSGARTGDTGSSWLPGPGSWLPGSVHNYRQGPVGVLTGFDQNAKPTPLQPDENGTVTVNIRELNRVVIQLEPAAWTGYHISGDQLKPLPIGSTLDVENGVFYWQPGPGFLGSYQLLFIAEQENQVRRVDVNITPGH